jgi:hypothetical protein
MAWTQSEIEKLKSLSGDKLFFSEIAKQLSKKPAATRYMARKLKLQNYANYRMGEWNSKHSQLREPVMKYFMTHTWIETLKKFKLTNSELKSLFSIGYKMPALKHLRKDTRRKDSWSAKEYKFLIRHSGLMPRIWIAEKLKRDKSEIVIKEKLSQLGLASKSVNGITLSQFRSAFGKDPEMYLQTEAGPSRGVHGQTYFKIVPWCWLDKQLKNEKLSAPKVFCQLVESMALFQEWIFEGNALKKLKSQTNKGMK